MAREQLRADPGTGPVGNYGEVALIDVSVGLDADPPVERRDVESGHAVVNWSGSESAGQGPEQSLASGEYQRSPIPAADRVGDIAAGDPFPFRRAHTAPSAQHRADQNAFLDIELIQRRQSVRPQADPCPAAQVLPGFDHAYVPAVLLEPDSCCEAPDSCSDDHGMSLRHQASFDASTSVEDRLPS
jgi:hypothetical protein